MKIVLAHLSDIHFKSKDNLISSRVADICNALRPVINDASACFIIVTGDIAFSGKLDEYNVALEFFQALLTNLKRAEPNILFQTIMIPGNHDCDFDQHNAVRASLLNDNNIIDKLTPDDDSVLEQVLGVQNNFFTFLELMEADNEGTCSKLKGYGRLYYERLIDLAGKKIRFNCYNSAWMSLLHEQQARVSFPIKSIKASGTESILTIAALHHPDFWLESNNGRDFRTQVEQTADIILTGHEHASGQYTKTTSRGQVNEYIEGAALQGDSLSSFNVIEIDLNQERKRVTNHVWNGEIYISEAKQDWVEVKWNRSAGPRRFENNDDFKRELMDPGVRLTHPSGAELTLQDIFIYPDLHHVSFDGSIKDFKKKRIKSEDVYEFINGNHAHMIAGCERSGRSALARFMYNRFHENGYVPILLDGRTLKRPDRDGFDKQIEKTFATQYKTEDSEHYRQLNKDLKLAIIDDFHLTRLNTAGKKLFLKKALERFGKLIIFIDELYTLREVLSDKEDITWSAFLQTEVCPLGYELRYELVRKWFSIGHDYVEDEVEFEHKVKNALRTIATLRGRNLLPSQPIFVLSILQIIEAKSELKTQHSAYAYFYEVFIRGSLSGGPGCTIPMDILMAYVSHVAFGMFAGGLGFIEEAEFERITDTYCESHAVAFNRQEMNRILEKAHILSQFSDGTFRFNYKYSYYYFVAKYIADNLRSARHAAELLSLINKLARTLYVEDHANIILFVVYLTKDENTIIQILNQAQKIYHNYEPCDLDSDIASFSSMLPPILFELTGGDVEENRADHYRRLDEIASALEAENEDDASTLEDQEKDLERAQDEVMQLNIAFKTLQIMGQILRNFPGSLDRELKMQIAKASCSLALRALKVMVQSLSDNIDAFRDWIVQLIKENDTVEDEREVIEKANKCLYVLMMSFAYGIIKRVSADIGSEHLEQIYAQVLKENGDEMPIALINVTIKLDCFEKFPRSEVLGLRKLLGSNLFTRAILCQLVSDRFRLYRADYRLKQEICAAVGIEFNAPRMIAAGSRN